MTLHEATPGVHSVPPPKLWPLLGACPWMSQSLPFMLPVMEIESKLIFLEAVGDAVVTKGAAVVLLLLCLVLVQTLPEPCVLPATVSGKKKRSCKSLEKSQRDD